MTLEEKIINVFDGSETREEILQTLAKIMLSFCEFDGILEFIVTKENEEMNINITKLWEEK